MLNPHATVPPVCACGKAVALAVSCHPWAGASHQLEQEEPLCTSAQVGCGAAAGGDPGYSQDGERVLHTDLGHGSWWKQTGGLAACSLCLLDM